MTHESIFNIYNYIVVFGGGIIAIGLWFVYKKTHSRPLLNSIPGIFTSLGLFGTFMSIVFALGNIKESDFSTIRAERDTEITVSQGMSVEDEVDAENGVKTADAKSTSDATDNTINIIKNLVPAFTSSILGLLLALLATVVCKIVFALEDNRLDKKIDGKTPEECLFGIMEQTSATTEILRTQESETKLYNEQLKSSIVEQNQILQKFIDGFVEKMGDIFDNMKSSIATQVESIGNDQLTKAGGILSSISEQLGAVTTQLLDAQKDSVKELVEKTNSQLETMAQSVASQYELIQQNASENVATMTALKEQYAQTNANMLQRATDMNKQATDDMRDSLQDFVSDIKESVSNECEALHTAIESNVATLTRSYNFLKDRLAQITHDYEQAGLAFDNAVTNSHRQNESTENAIRKANESLTLLEGTNERIGELLDAFNCRQDNIETLISHINEIGSAIAALQKLETQLKRLNK
jgi:gas vesicle protein